MIEIPLPNDPMQLFNIILNGQKYDIEVKVNARADFWTISFLQEGTPVVQGVPMVGGVDILRQYAVPIKNMFMVNLDDVRLDPDIDGLGTVSKLFLLEDSELSGG